MSTLPSDILGSSRVWDRSLARGNISASAGVYEVDPLKDRRWPAFLKRHPQSSIFHSVVWLNSLRRTYGYQPVVYTTSPTTSELKNGILFCRIRSWATGKRLVSLPFSDHCMPLCDREEDFERLICHLQTDRSHQKWKYLEIRPRKGSFDRITGNRGFKLAGSYVLHYVDLEPAAEEIFRRFNKKSVQLRIRRAERAGVVEVCGASERRLKEFYRLMILTRARHNLPPQPFAWFRNLLDSAGKAADLRFAYVSNVPVAAILVLHFKNVSYYKYGCSDQRFHNLGVMPFLLWRAMLNAKSIGSRGFDLGRAAEDHHSLIAFKDHWTPISQSLRYWRFPSERCGSLTEGWKLKMANRICTYIPSRLLQAAGTLMYRHVG